MDNTYIAFTHRPVAGISVGAYNDNGVLYIAAAFANDGYSRNGNLREDHVDLFSRPRARQIIAGRINDAVETFEFAGEFLPQGRFVTAIRTDVSGREFMRNFRQAFKPEVDESDDLFSYVYSEDGVVIERARMRIDDMWNRIVDMAQEATVLEGTETTGN